MSQTKFQSASANEDRTLRAAGEAAHSAGAAIRDASDEALNNAADMGARASRRADDALHDLARAIETQPISSVLIAAGVGLLAGMLLSRR